MKVVLLLLLVYQIVLGQEAMPAKVNVDQLTEDITREVISRFSE